MRISQTSMGSCRLKNESLCAHQSHAIDLGKLYKALKFCSLEGPAEQGANHDA